MKKYLIRAVCTFPSLAHRIWFLLPRNYRQDHLKRLLLKVVAKGDVCFEVGANVGQYTTFISYLVGGTGSVVAFEPLPGNLSLLGQQIESRKAFDNIKVEGIALSNEEGETQMYVPGNAGAMASLARHQNEHWQYFESVNEVRVRTGTLDHYVRQHHVDRIDLLKVDIEGAESLFLAGAEETIRRFKPLIVMEILESMSATFKSDPRKTFVHLEKRGYVYRYQLTRLGCGLRRVYSPTSEMLNSVLDDFVFSTRELAWTK